VDLTGFELTDVPLALAERHREVAVGARIELTLPSGDAHHVERARAVVAAGGFEIDRWDAATDPIEATVTAQRALPDHVGPDMRLLCCGLNPSLHAADAGVGYVTGSNRFWKAMALAGLSTSDRDPFHLLRHDHIGMTDLVKRPTARADELSTVEYRTGVERLEVLCDWLRPAAVAVVGLAGWRAAVERKAVVGWQDRTLGPSPVYLLPSTSGLNAGTSLDDLVGHLLQAAGGPAT
jgi:TDG/mug DNA glycosylase family protein